MTIAELKLKYSDEELYSLTADKKQRYEMYAPLLSDLFENKVIYHERFRGIIKLDEIKITPERFTATAIPYLLIEQGNRFDKYFFERSWEIGATWECVRLTAYNALTPYSGWRMWCEPETVKKAEELAFNKKFDEVNTLMNLK